MSRIVVTTIGSLGDLHPKIASALELRKRGHNVIFATQNVYQAKIEALIVVPYLGDQPDNAARLKRLGTSRTILRKQYSASRLVKELSQLVGNPSYAAKAAEIGRIVQAENGASIACDEIEKQLEKVAII